VDRLKALTRLMRAAPPDVVSGAFLLVVAIAYGVVALGIPRGDGEPGPGAMPIALAVLLAGLSAWILAQGLRAASGPGSEAVTDAVAGGGTEAERDGVGGERAAEDTDGVDSQSAERARGGRSWLAALATLAYVALFEPLGFMVSTLAYTAALAWLFGRDRRALVAVPVALPVALPVAVPVGVTVALFVFFRLALGVRLPLGPFG